MKIIVDWDRCEANALCMRVSPDVFRVDEEDRLHVLADEVPEARRAEMEKAVRSCPKAALSLTKT